MTLLTEIAYTMIRRDANGEETERKADHVYLKMREEVVECIKHGKIPLEVTLTMQHIAELQGYNFAGVEHITY